ncbi:MAG: hypothetical protein BDTLLHRC_001435, partial [Candidatus Fervidibacter sp.]
SPVHFDLDGKFLLVFRPMHTGDEAAEGGLARP